MLYFFMQQSQQDAGNHQSIWVQWTQKRLGDDLSFFTWCFPAGSSHQTMGRHSYSGRLWSLNNAQLVLRGSKFVKSAPPSTAATNCWCKTGWNHAFISFTPPNPDIEMSQQKLRFVTTGNVFPSFCCAIVGSPCEILLLGDMSSIVLGPNQSLELG